MRSSNAIATLVVFFALGCAEPKAHAAHAIGNHFAACPVDPEGTVVVAAGEIPLVLSSTHAGTSRPRGCDPGSDVVRDLDTRACSPSLDLVCESGPCRTGGADRNARSLTFALRDELATCLGKAPALAITNVERSVVDMNRDADDRGGEKCAMQDTGSRLYWEAYHHALEGLVRAAVAVGGDHALLVDVHTYDSLPKAPSPSIMIGTGDPVGTTLPHQKSEDADLPLVYGKSGLRARLADTLTTTAHVLPASLEADLDGLYNGRYVVRRYSRTVDDDTKTAGPAIDALQIEVSSRLRDDVDQTARALAYAICGAFGERLKSAPVNE